MKKQFTFLSILVLAVFNCFMLAGQANAETEVSGIINSNTTWTLNNSPYIVIDTVQIPTGVTLTIESGVTINKPTNGDMFLLNGIIYAHGVVDNKIIFDGGSNSDFFNVTGYENAFLDLKYCTVKNGLMFWPGGNRSGHFYLQYSELANLAEQSTIWFPTDNIDISYNKFINTYGFRIYIDNNIKVNIKNNFFYKGHSVNNTGYWNFYIIVESQDSSEVIIKYNSFINMNDIVLKLGSDSINTFSASENYWDTQDVNVIDSTIYDKNDDITVENYINYLPILTEPHPDTPTFTICTSWIYSNWSECIDEKQTRSIISFSPDNCIDGNPVLSQSCQVETNDKDNTETTTQHESETNENNPNSPIPEGAVIKTGNNPDVYIVKYKNGKQFKRLVLNPQVFESYGHLKWEDILTVSQSEMDSFIVSDLVRVDGQIDIYQLVPNGDVGTKVLLESTIGYDLDLVYTINGVDFGNYVICSYDFYNCSDFGNQVDAQRIFDICGGINNDIHKLDGDNNGVPCESSSWSY